MTYKNTPVPWVADHDGSSRPIITTKDLSMLSISKFESGRWVSYEQEEGDAALIVKAVNSHQAMVDAIKLAIHNGENVPGLYLPWPATTMDALRAALKQAEGG